LSRLALGLGLTLGATVSAEPWMSPGDVRLRHDLQQLSDQGLLSGPTLSWPIGWSQVARELRKIDAAALSPSEQATVERLLSRAAREMRAGDVGVVATLAGAVDPTQLRTFETTPREEGEATLSADWLGQRFAWKLSAAVVADPDDDRELRPDGSYLAMSLGNWMISAGYLDRWWGPGWQGSLILSNNARPMPSIAIDRNESTPFDVPVLRWLGPWRLSTFMQRFESDRDYSDALLFGLRAEIRPHPTLQIAASRTAQWCGDGRPCDLDTFWDLLVGNDNDQDLSAQAIGEDEAGFMPSKYLGLFGAEVWGDLAGGTWRAHVEYADTTCDFLRSPPEFGCAYTNSIYTSGYRYRGRVVGHSIDADGEAIGAGALFIDSLGHRWEVLGRNAKLNRAGVAPEHSLADGEARVNDLAVTHDRALAWGNITVSLGYTDVDSAPQTVVEDGMRGFVTWSREFR
jgi:hypothetical protein